MRLSLISTLPLILFVACGDDAGPADAGTDDAGASDSSVTADAGDAGASDASLGDTGLSDAATGPVIEVHVRTNSDVYNHTDGYSGQTSREAYQGIRRVELLRQEGDPSPLVLFDYGDGFVEAGYNAGDDTVVGAARIADLVDGHFTVGRSVVTHSRYKVNAVMHANALSIPGEFDNVQVLSDRTEVNGQARSQGWFRYVFKAAGMEFPLEGDNAPLPSTPTTGGFRLDLNNGEATYTFPVDITVDTSSLVSASIVMEVNMYESFRWEDQTQTDYAPDVFDATPTGSEPVRRFGANTFNVYVE
jgi:hypothetical protein